MKGKTYGHKKDNRTEKLEKYQALKDKRYYPMHPQSISSFHNKHNIYIEKNIDEWGAIEKHQHETVQAIERIKNDEKQATKNELKYIYIYIYIFAGKYMKTIQNFKRKLKRMKK